MASHDPVAARNHQLAAICRMVWAGTQAKARVGDGYRQAIGMPEPLNALEAAALARLAVQLEQQGYTVTHTGGRGARSIDLVASTSTERLAVTVIAPASLRDAHTLLRRLRTAAARQGCTDYRLVVVHLPPEASVLVAGVEHQLFHYLLWHVPGALLHLAPSLRIEAVQHGQIEAMTLTRQHVEVSGTGVVAVTLLFDASRAAAPRTATFPCRFRVFLDRRLRHLVVADFALDVPGGEDEGARTS